jgi:hypothetical protein
MISQNHINKSPIVDLLGEDPRTVFTSNGYFTVPLGVKQIFLVACGGGGGGGVPAGAWASGGGGGGGVAVGWYKVTPGETIDVRVGEGGRGGIPSVFGLDGGTTVFGNVMAFGGRGGGQGTSTTDGGHGGNGGKTSGFLYLPSDIVLPKGTDGEQRRPQSMASTTTSPNQYSSYALPLPGIDMNGSAGAAGDYSGGGGAATRYEQIGQFNRGGSGLTGGGAGSLHPTDANGRQNGAGWGGAGLLQAGWEPHGMMTSTYAQCNGGNGGAGGGGGAAACGSSNYAGQGGDGVVMIWG